MCIWQELKKVNNCKGCPLYDDQHFQYCDDLEDIQDIVNLIGTLENMLDRLEETDIMHI